MAPEDVYIFCTGASRPPPLGLVQKMTLAYMQFDPPITNKNGGKSRIILC